MEEKITRNTKWLVYSDDMDDMLGDREERLQTYSECCDVPLDEIEEDPFEDWCASCMRSYYEDFNSWLTPNQECLLIADTGLWYGRRAGGDIDTISSLLSRAYQDDNEVYYFPKDGHIEITAHHHDGTNYYKIYGLSAEGKRYARNHEYDDPRTVHNHLLRNKSKYFCPVEYSNF